MTELGDRVLSDGKLDPQRANAAAHAWAKAEAMMQPKTRVELTGANSGPVSVVNEPSMEDLARRIAHIFHQAALEKEKPASIEDAANGGN